MKDQVVMSKSNAQLAIAVPLFRGHNPDKWICNTHGYSIVLMNTEPSAYIMQYFEYSHVWSAEFVEQECEFLGDL